MLITRLGSLFPVEEDYMVGITLCEFSFLHVQTKVQAPPLLVLHNSAPIFTLLFISCVWKTPKLRSSHRSPRLYQDSALCLLNIYHWETVGSWSPQEQDRSYTTLPVHYYARFLKRILTFRQGSFASQEKHLMAMNLSLALLTLFKEWHWPLTI